MSKIKLGDYAKDKITGIEGVVTAKATYLTGCARFHIQPRELKDGKPIEGIYFDEDQLEVTHKQVIRPETLQGKEKGACAPDPAK